MGGGEKASARLFSPLRKVVLLQWGALQKGIEGIFSGVTPS